MPPKPSVKAILTCDYIIHEHLTNKKSLIGIFEDIHLLRFPSTHPRIGVYVNLTGAHGKYTLEVRLITPDGQEIGPIRTPEVEIDSPLRTCEFALQAHNIPFYVAAPSTTFDLALPSGDHIPIEQRSAEEITDGFGRRTAPEGVQVYNPAFDVTPARLIAGIITEKGILRPPFEKSIAEHIGRPAEDAAKHRS